MCHELSNRLAWAWARRSSRRHVVDVDDPDGPLGSLSEKQLAQVEQALCVDVIEYWCSECGKPITGEQVDERHTSPDGEDVHAEGCEACGRQCGGTCEARRYL